jgi:hypothetical protein
MKTLAVTLLVLVLAGCTNAPVVQPIIKLEVSSGNDVCQQAAAYARTIAVLREAGINSLQLQEFVVTPKAVLFPTTQIQLRVYSQKTPPNVAYDEVHALCVANGWQNLRPQLVMVDTDPVLKLDTELKTKPRRKSK